MVDGTDIVVETNGQLCRFRKIAEDDWEQLLWTRYGCHWDDSICYATVCESVLTADAVFVASKDEP